MAPIASVDAARTAFTQLPQAQRSLLSRLQARTTTVAEFAAETGMSAEEVRGELRAAMHTLASAERGVGPEARATNFPTAIAAG